MRGQYLVNTKMRIKKIIIIFIIILSIWLIWNIRSQYEKSEKLKNGLLGPGVYLGVYAEKNDIIDNLIPLEVGIQNYIQDNNLNASVYIASLRNGNAININGETEYYPLSLSKLPIAILIMQKIEVGKLSLNTKLPIKDENRIYSPYGFYNTTAKELSINELMESMLKKSDNTAFKVLSDQIEESDLNRSLAYFSFNIAPYHNWTEPTEKINTQIMANILISLYGSTVLNIKDSEYILQLLSESIFDIKNISGMPEDVKITHKWGENNDEYSYYFHDCGIVYFKKHRALYCIMTKDLDRQKAIDFISLILKNIYKYQEMESSLSEEYKKLDGIKLD